MTPTDHIPLLREHMLQDLAAAFDREESGILDAIEKLAANRNEEEALVFAVSFGGKLNFDKSAIETSFSYAVKTVVKEKHLIDDPRQGQLDLDEQGAPAPGRKRTRKKLTKEQREKIVAAVKEKWASDKERQEA